MLTLGFVLTVIVGALQQIAPVAMGVAARRGGLAHTAFALLSLGTLVVVIGISTWSGALIGLGWLAITTALGVTWYNLLGPLRHATRGKNAARAVRAGFASFGLALLVVFARIGNMMGWWAVSPNQILIAHVHLALGGFATVIAMGIGSHVLPMLLTVRSSVTWAGNTAWRATAAGTTCLAAGVLIGSESLRIAGAASLSSGVIVWLVFVAACFHRRGRRGLDVSLTLIASAHVMLAAALVAGLSLLVSSDAHRATAYVIAGLLGWLGLFITGVASRIIPTLMRVHRAKAGNARPARVVLPHVTSLAAFGIIGAAAGLAIAASAGHARAVYAATIVHVVGVGLLLVQHGAQAWTRRRASE
jgi:hypothetical protein